MADETNLPSLVLICDACHHTEPAAPVFRDHDGQTVPVDRFPTWWPRHCDRPMRLANTTDRDGAPLELEHPYESELP